MDHSGCDEIRHPTYGGEGRALGACRDHKSEDAANYDRTEAFAWRLEYRTKLHTGTAHVAPSSPPTMAIDLRGRSTYPTAAMRVD